MLSIIVGIFLKKTLDKFIGKEESFILSGVFMGIGFLLFAIDFKMVMFLGVPLGIILAQQFKTQQYTFKAKSSRSKAFLYSFIFAIIIINLFPKESYFIAKWSFAIALLGIAIVQLLVFFKFESRFKLKDVFEGKFEKSAKIPQFISIVLAFMFLLLFNLTISQERYYYHLIWGLESFPTKITIQLAIATCCLIAILLYEFVGIKNVELTVKNKSFIFLIAIIGYIFIPFLIQGVLVFFLIHILLVFGTILMIEHLLLRFPQFVNPDVPTNKSEENRTKDKVKGYNLFIFGFIFWFMFLFVLMVTPPVTIVVDTYNLFEKAGILGITDLEWSPFFWTLFYIPSIYMFLALPLTIYCLSYGIIFTLFSG
jgi:hypothetical protein